MESRAPDILPPRGVSRSLSKVARATARHKVGIGTTVLVAGVLAVAIAVTIPRPNVSIQTQQILAPGCVAPSTAQTVTARFTLGNSGPVDGTVTVQLLSDDQTVGSAMLIVAAGGTASGVIEATVHDCSIHRYALIWRYEAPPGG